jgi:hypothetical protein
MSRTRDHGTGGRLAIIGAGSSGLVTLKYALDRLAGWQVVCYEASDSTRGCWGFPYRGFVSTTTKYTTQFACYPVYDAVMQSDDDRGYEEFFRDDEYGRYLDAFAQAHGLRDYIGLGQRVRRVDRVGASGGWRLTVVDKASGAERLERFDAVIMATGLVADQPALSCDIPQLTSDAIYRHGAIESTRNQRVVVVGGGESAVDHAARLADPALGNQVVMSLRSGIRVSPRYHPIRGVPSDFLRNRFMLAINRDFRNAIGQRFVEARIRYREWFERAFGGGGREADATASAARRREWDFRLTRAAKDELFSVFHNKSDDFLDLVGDGRIEIVGPAIDDSYRVYRGFDSSDQHCIEPDLMVPAIGYRSTLSELTDGQVRLRDCYLGCCPVAFDDLFVVGFARPIIGNIPAISEMQARYIIGQLAGDHARPSDLAERHRCERDEQERHYPRIDQDAVYPVEMFPYCDQLAREMGVSPWPSWWRSPRRWIRVNLAPASTMHYDPDDESARRLTDRAPVYMPPVLIALLALLRLPSSVYSGCQRLFARRHLG